MRATLNVTRANRQPRKAPALHRLSICQTSEVSPLSTDWRWTWMSAKAVVDDWRTYTVLRALHNSERHLKRTCFTNFTYLAMKRVTPALCNRIIVWASWYFCVAQIGSLAKRGQAILVKVNLKRFMQKHGKHCSVKHHSNGHHPGLRTLSMKQGNLKGGILAI